MNFFFSEHSNTLIIMALFTAVSFAPFLIAWIRKNFNPFEPIYLWTIIYGYLYLAKPFVQIAKGQTFRYGGEYLNEALLLAILGLIVFYLGYYFNFGNKIANRIPIIKTEISSNKLFYVAWIFIIIGFWALNHYIQISGGWKIFWSRPHGLAGQATKSTAYLYQLPELMVIGFILIYEIFIHKIIVKKNKIKAKNILNLLIAAIGGVGIYTIMFGNRSFAFWIILAAIILYFLKKQELPRLRTAAIVILALFIIVSFIPMYRSYIYIGSDLSKISEALNLKKIIGASFTSDDEFHSYLAEIALVPNSIPYDNFNLYFKTIIHPIPRLIWPNKPALLNSNWDDFLSKSGLSRGAAESLLGDFYAQLGIMGIIIGTFFSGILWKTIYQYLKKAPMNRSVIIIYAVVFPNIITYLAQGTLIAFLKWLPYMIPSIIIALLLSRKKLQ